MDMLIESFLLLLELVAGSVLLRILLRKIRFRSEYVLDIRHPDGRTSSLELRRLKGASAAEREAEVRRATSPFS
jgi:hypothetical protein